MSASLHVPENADIAERVLMPGDPLRAKYIAENYLDDARLINDIRAMYGYTGFYEGTEITVQASGMGIPSMGIYSYELFEDHDVKYAIRIGTAGSIKSDAKLSQIVFATSASTTSNYQSEFQIDGYLAPVADISLLTAAIAVAQKDGLNFMSGNVLTEESFYSSKSSHERYEHWKRLGISAIEMETAALYINAAYHGVKALSMLTITDNIETGEKLSVSERETGLDKMIKLALSTISSM